MKKTNFDRYLEEQIKDREFAARFRRAGEDWGLAFAARRQPKQASQGKLHDTRRTSQ